MELTEQYKQLAVNINAIMEEVSYNERNNMFGAMNPHFEKSNDKNITKDSLKESQNNFTTLW